MTDRHSSPGGGIGALSCDDVRPYLEAFSDDELSAERTIDVEAHLGDCKECRTEVEFSRALVNLTRSAMADAPMCPDFQARLGNSLGAERRRQEQKEGVIRPLSWRVIAPLAAAAAITLFFGVKYAPDNSLAASKASVISAETNLVDTLLKNHTTPPAPSVTAADSLSTMEPQLGFPVRPPNFERFGASFVGASYVHVNQAQVASLRYRLANGRRVTFYVYDAEKMPLRSVRQLHPRVVGNKAVFVGQRRGYSFATVERKGIGYAIAADLPDEESAQLVAAVDYK